jgi:hypothetical protein
LVGSGTVFALKHSLSSRQVDILLAGGLINHMRRKLTGAAAG